MYNFTHDIGTIVHFGKGQIEKLPGAVKQYANKVLLTYGGGSIKKNGIYDAVIKALRKTALSGLSSRASIRTRASPLCARGRNLQGAGHRDHRRRRWRQHAGLLQGHRLRRVLRWRSVGFVDRQSPHTKERFRCSPC